MAFDGIVVSNVVHEIKEKVIGGRVYKIYQPEEDEINLVIKANRENVRLLLSANASLPLLYVAKEGKDNPMTAPNFCMVLRKHIGNGTIVDVYQPGFERIVVFKIEHLDEMGDLGFRYLIIELMGKHSNIILLDSKQMILDSIKHISVMQSSVREVLPGRDYSYPPNKDKENPLEITKEQFVSIFNKPLSVCKALYTSLTGFSPVAANEICYEAHIDGNLSSSALDDAAKEKLYLVFADLVENILNNRYRPVIAFNNGKPEEFSAFSLNMYEDCQIKEYDSISELLMDYYRAREIVTRIRQKSNDLRKIVSNAIERVSKKYDLQLKQLKVTEKRDKYRIYGELLNTYGYNVENGASELKALNYYTGEEVLIPLDKDLTPLENSKKYFAKYNKLKRTYEALTELTLTTEADLMQLKSIETALDISESMADLNDIKQELVDSLYIKGKVKDKKARQVKSKPYHFLSKDGYDIYVGKNNYQNEELTFKEASGKDMWFHAKHMPGSHVIVKVKDGEEIPDTTYEEAARLAAYYSAGRNNDKVEIDYTRRNNLKKPPKAKPGFVIYHTNYSMTISPDITDIKEI